MRSLRLPTLWKYTTRQMQRRPGRTLLTLLGIAIGVATIVAVSLTTQATRRAYRDMFEAVTGRASFEIVAEGLGGFDASLTARLESVPGLKAAVPVIQAPAALVGKSGAVPVLVLGVDPTRDSAARDYVLQKGRLLASDGRKSQEEPADGILLEAGFAESNGFELGKPARLLTPTGMTRLPVVGLLEPHGAASFNGGAVVFMPQATAQRLFALPHRVNSVQLVLADGANPQEVEAEVLQRLPPGLTVQTPSARGELAQHTLLSTEQSLAGLSLVSLAAAAFVILNTFLINLGERRRQLAILRSLGASRAQITQLLLREAALLGFAGTVLGIPAGWGLSLALRRVMEQLIGGVILPDLHWTVEAYVLAMLFGPGMAVAATYFPARRAGRRAPLEDLFQPRQLRGEDIRRWPCYVGLALIVASLTSVIEVARGRLPPNLGAPLMALAVVGCVLIIPFGLVPLTHLVAWLLKPVLGLQGRLALRHLDRHRSRTALTVQILSLAVLMSISFGNTLLLFLRDIHVWYEHVAQGDFFIRGSIPDAGYSITLAALPETLAEEIGRLDGVEHVDKLNWILGRAGGQRVAILAYTFADDRPLPLDLVAGDAASVRHGLSQGEVVLGTALARRLGLGVGDEITLETRQGPQALRIAGTANEYTIDGLALYMDWNTAKRLFDSKGVHVFLVTAGKEAAADVAGRLKSFCEGRGLLLQSNADLRRHIDRAIAGIVVSAWVLLALVFVVASLGIVNTLTMNVLEQSKEIGVLRALGMKRIQVRQMILSQALVIGVISLVPGLVIGSALSYVFNSVSRLMLAHPLPFRFDAMLISVCLVVALAIAVLAAYFPARRAARLKVIQALQYE